MKKPAFPTLFVSASCLGITLWAAFWIAVIWTACHFIAKFW